MSRSESNPGGGAGANVRETAQQVKENIRDMGGQVRDAATEQYTNLRNQATEYFQEGRERAQEWEQSIETYVQEKPIQSILIAAGVGMLLGILWKRS
ncbi:MAG: DUF883 domain-containing protein [Anaerolineae bacterium]|nr:DUF883 domain-containing protein [Phycisphaerae bacterium]